MSVIGQFVTWPSLQFPSSQQVNVAIFIIYYGMLPGFHRYLVHIILNQRPCQILEYSDHKQ